jgi:serine/threonine-protein kinase RsbW
MIYRYQKTVAEFDFETMNREVEAFCARHAVSGNKLYAVQLVIEELVTNILKYGNGKMITVAVAKGTEGLKLTVTDDSAPFNPLEAEQPDIGLAAEERHAGGLGLFLVGKMVKSLNYEHKGGCNVLTAEL